MTLPLFPDIPPDPEPGEVAHARRTDPDTSHEAAASITDLSIRQRAVLWLFETHGAMADVELVERYREALEDGSVIPLQGPSGIRTRRHELVGHGKLEDRGKRKIGPRHHHVWGLTGA